MLKHARKLLRPNPPLCAVVIFALTLGLRTEAQKVITSQYDNARTGANLHETSLTPLDVNVQQLGKIFTLHVDGEVYAQPLFVSGVEIPGKGRHDVLFVATEHDSVYAFDAYTDGPPLWQVSFLKDGETAVPADDAQCPFIAPDIGITSTPVINPNSGTLYVLARTRGPRVLLANTYYQRLHALALATGAEKFGGPAEIQASMSGTGRGSSNGRLVFNPLRDNPRAAMLLNNGVVYLTWASSCDVGAYHGWVMAYDARSLKQKAVFNASPDGDDSGIWGGDTGPAADNSGNVFVSTGNGRFDAAKGGRDYGDTLLKLDGQTLKVSDYFAPFNVDELDASDNDLGSGGPMLLPDQPGAHPHLAVVEGKGGVLYMVDRDHMGHWQAANDPGTKGYYCSGGVAVVGRLIENVVHMRLPEFAQANLFAPLGISRAQWRWNYDLTNADKEYSQIHLRPRDMLKLGILFADRGRWHGRQVVSASWVRGALAEQSHVDNVSYGYFWWRPWLNVETTAGPQHVDIIAAQGNGGQKIYLVPQYDLVAVFTAGGYNAESTPPNTIMAKIILPALMAAHPPDKR